MKVIIPKTSGFCPGVKRAEEGVFKLKENSDSVNLHGPLIHNQNYIEMLKRKNIQETDIKDLKENDILVIRTHGISRFEELELAKKFQLKDLTCPIVKRVQKNVEKASQDDAFIIISGKANHAEVQGLVSYAEHHIVIENQAELQQFLENHEKIIPQHRKKLFIISQTTHSREFFEVLCTQIQLQIQNIEIEIKDTICAVTENKEQESLRLQKEADFTIVIGDPSSSNSKKLYSILKNSDPQTIFIQNLKHLKETKSDWNNIETILVVSSTSTPQFIEKEIVEFLEEYPNLR